MLTRNFQRLAHIRDRKGGSMNRFPFISLFIVLITLFGCEDEDEDDIKHLNSFPRWNNSLLKSDEVFLFFTKDLGQEIFSEEQHRPNQSPKQMPAVLKVGGLSTIGSYLKIAKEQFGNQSIILNGPPLLQRSNSREKNRLILSSLTQMPFDATLFTHQELITAKQMQDENYHNVNWVNSNTISIKTASAISVWDNLSHRVVQSGSIKIGIVGVAELENINEEQKTQLQGHYFKGATTAILKLKKQLKIEGTKFNILIYNGKNPCQNKVPHRALSFAKQKPNTECLQNTSLEKIVSKLPPNLIHLIVVTKGEFTRAQISQIPVLGNPEGNLYLTGVKLVFDELGKLENEKSFFIAPIKYCQKMFAGLEDCQFTHSNSDHQRTRLKHLDKTAFGLVKARFLGREVQKDTSIEAIINDTPKSQSQDK